MRMYLRLLLIILTALLRRRNLSLSDESVLSFVVMPGDCVFRVMGNDRYHAFMDLGRLDLLIRMDGWHMLMSKKLQPFVHTAHIRYRYPLHLFQTFVLKTRLVHTNNSFFVMEHTFQMGNTVMATAISKNGLMIKKKIVSTRNILRHMEGTGLHYSEKKVLTLAAVERLLRGLQDI